MYQCGRPLMLVHISVLHTKFDVVPDPIILDYREARFSSPSTGLCLERRHGVRFFV